MMPLFDVTLALSAVHDTDPAHAPDPRGTKCRVRLVASSPPMAAACCVAFICGLQGPDAVDAVLRVAPAVTWAGPLMDSGTAGARPSLLGRGGGRDLCVNYRLTRGRRGP